MLKRWFREVAHAVDGRAGRSVAIAMLVCVVGCDDVPPVAFEIEETVSLTPGGTEHVVVRVPGGVFTMGSESGTDDEGPIHQVHLDDFYIDKLEVSNEKYLVFVGATGAAEPVHVVSDRFNKPQQPVVGIVWEEAAAYCDWAGLRLPTEAEWEKAARGLEALTYPWGDDPPSSSLARYQSTEGPSSVGNFPTGQSPFGALDMAGNVWEYVRDHYVADYYRISPDRNPIAIVGDGEPDHTIRGGSWASSPDEMRSTRRFRAFLIEADLPDSQVGFRCAKD